MSSGPECPVFVLTDTPDVYGNAMIHRDSTPIYVKTVAELLARLKSISMAGLVLEMVKVMKAERKERERLFNYVNTFPVLRTKINARHGFVEYLDPKDAFFSNLETIAGKFSRNYARVKVNFECAFSAEDDPSMAVPTSAIVGDISPGGCFINIDLPPNEHFIHLRIPELSNKRPIFSSVRWTRTEGNQASQGMGVMFIDPTEDQFDELKEIKPTD